MQDDPEGLSHHAIIDVGFSKSAHPKINTVNSLHRVPVDQHDVGVGSSEGSNIRRVENEIRIGHLELGDQAVTQIVARLEVFPGRVRRQVTSPADSLTYIGTVRVHERLAHLVQSAEPDIASARHVERKQVRADAHEIIAQGVDDIHVCLFCRLLADPLENGTNADLLITRLGYITELRE